MRASSLAWSSAAASSVTCAGLSITPFLCQFQRRRSARVDARERAESFVIHRRLLPAPRRSPSLRSFLDGLVNDPALGLGRRQPLVRVAFGPGLRPHLRTLPTPFAQADGWEGQVSGPCFDETARGPLDENSGNVARVVLDQKLAFGAAEIGAQDVRPIGEAVQPYAIRSELAPFLRQERNPEGHAVVRHAKVNGPSHAKTVRCYRTRAASAKRARGSASASK